MGNDNIKNLLLELEEMLMMPVIRRSPEEVSKLLADEFIEFGASGKVWTKEQIIEELQNEPEIKFTISDFDVRELAPDIMLARYRVKSQLVDDNKVGHSLRSSIWKQIDGHWQMVFHQGTRAPTD